MGRRAILEAICLQVWYPQHSQMANICQEAFKRPLWGIPMTHSLIPKVAALNVNMKGFDFEKCFEIGMALTQPLPTWLKNLDKLLLISQELPRISQHSTRLRRCLLNSCIDTWLSQEHCRVDPYNPVHEKSIKTTIPLRITCFPVSPGTPWPRGHIRDFSIVFIKSAPHLRLLPHHHQHQSAL